MNHRIFYYALIAMLATGSAAVSYADEPKAPSAQGTMGDRLQQGGGSMDEKLHQATIAHIETTMKMIESRLSAVPAEKKDSLSLIDDDLKTYLAETKASSPQDGVKHHRKSQGILELAMEISHDGMITPQELQQWKAAFADRNNFALATPTATTNAATPAEAAAQMQRQETKDAAEKAFKDAQPQK